MLFSSHDWEIMEGNFSTNQRLAHGSKSMKSGRTEVRVDNHLCEFADPIQWSVSDAMDRNLNNHKPGFHQAMKEW